MVGFLPSATLTKITFLANVDSAKKLAVPSFLKRRLPVSKGNWRNVLRRRGLNRAAIEFLDRAKERENFSVK